MLKLVDVEYYSKWKRESKETSNRQFWKKLERPEDTKQGMDHRRHRSDRKIIQRNEKKSEKDYRTTVLIYPAGKLGQPELVRLDYECVLLFS